MYPFFRTLVVGLGACAVSAGALTASTVQAQTVAQTVPQAVVSQAAVQAERAADIDALFAALDMEAMLALLQEEGVSYGDELANQMLPDGTGPVWQALVAELHDPEALGALMRGGFEESFGDTDVTPLVEFYRSDTGKRIVELELAARRSFMDQDVEDAARASYRDIAEPFSPRLGAIEAFVEQNDLVEMNVTGALNSNFMFMRGLVQGGAFEMSERDILADIWAQEGETRVDSREWVYAFLTMAYQPLSVEEIEAYVAMSATPEGVAMNRALFAGFDRMYGAISLSLGVALAQQMQGQTL